MKMYAVRECVQYEIWDLIFFSVNREEAQAFADAKNGAIGYPYEPYEVEEWELNE